MKNIAFLILSISIFHARADEGKSGYDALLASQVESQVLLLKVERLLGEFFEAPKTLSDYTEYLPDTDDLGWCCTVSPSDIPYNLRTFDFVHQVQPNVSLQFEFVTDKNYKGKVLDMKIYAARLFCTLEAYATRFYLEPHGFSNYEDHLETMKEDSNQSAHTTPASAPR